MAQPSKDYRWGLGWNEPLNDLVLVGEDLKSYTGVFRIYPASQPPDLYPIRNVALDGYRMGDGGRTLIWQITALPIAAYAYLEATYFTPGGSTAMTIYTRFHNEGGAVLKRCNVWLDYPQPGPDYIYSQMAVRDVTLRFSLIEIL